jgi:tetratricopeptide (TPR) repeat protein
MNVRPAVATFALLFSSLAASAQFDHQQSLSAPFANNNTLTVTVKDAKGSPVADARVEVRSISSQGSMSYAYTNGSGVAQVANLAGGYYEVTATKNVSQTTERANIGGMDASLDMRLPVDGDPQLGDSNSVSVAQYRVPGKARDEFKKGREALEHRKLDDAARHVAKALEIYPNYSDALMLRGLMALDSTNKDSAIADLEAAIKADSGNSFAHFALGAAYSTESRFDDAIRTLQRGLALSPQSWQGYFELGKAEIGKADYKAAIRSLDRAEGLTKDFPLVHLVKAHALLALRSYDEAMMELQDFLQAAPKDKQSDEARKMLTQVQAFRGQQ